MKKNKLYIITLTLFFAILFNGCKKYEDGGFVYLTRKHLFGGHSTGSSKTWKLKLYEVNGIDSTYAIPGANNIPDFYEKFITFKLTDSKYLQYSFSTYLYNQKGSIDDTYKHMSVGVAAEIYSKEDSTQCKTVNNITLCSRNILFPELQNYPFIWQIQKLTKTEFVITTKMKNSYKITLSQ